MKDNAVQEITTNVSNGNRRLLDVSRSKEVCAKATFVLCVRGLECRDSDFK